MAQSTFTPAAPPGFAVNALFQGATQAQSIMGRAQQMRISQEQADRAQQEFDVMQPIIEAKGRADLSIAQATLHNAQQKEELRAQFGNDSKAAQKEFQDAMQNASYDTRAQSLSGLAQKYSYFDLLPEGKPFLDTIKNAQLQAHNDFHLDNTTQASLELESLRAENAVKKEQIHADELRQTYQQFGKGETQDQKNLRGAQILEDQGDTTGATALRNVVQKRGTSAGGKAGATIGLLDAINHMSADPSADPEVLQSLKNVLHKQGNWAPQKQAEFQQNLTARKEAIERGDTETADALEARNRALAFKSDLPDTYPTRDRPKEGPGFLERLGEKLLPSKKADEAIPATKPIEFPTGSKTTTVDGKEYPIAIDAKGHRAYYKDGHYFPIP